MTHNPNDELLAKLEARRNEWNNTALRTVFRDFKTVLLGASGVGKTSLVNRHIRGIFNPGSESTIGASFFTNKINTSIGTIMLSIWDTAGQERYASLIPMYYRDAAIALIVFDLADMDSFKRAKNWIETINENRSTTQTNTMNTEIILIGNKMDKEQQIIARLDREAKVYAAEKYIYYAKTSARTGEGVVDVFVTAIIRKLQAEAKKGPQNIFDDSTIRLTPDSKPGFFSSCMSMPSFLTPSYWRGTDQAQITDENVNRNMNENVNEEAEKSIN